MGRIEDLESDEKAKAKAGSTVAAFTGSASQPARAGAEWIPNTTGPQPDGETQVPGRRSTDQFVSAKRERGALAPTPAANVPCTSSANTCTNTSPASDPYSHLRPNAWRDVRHHAHTSDPQDIPPQEAEIAYEVVAVAVNPDEDEGKGGKKNRNPFRDWRVWLLIVAVAVIVGVSVGLAVDSSSSGGNSTTNALGQQKEQLDKEASFPEEVVGEENGGDNGDNIDEISKMEETDESGEEEEKNYTPTEPLPTLPPTQGPTESPRPPAEELPPPTSQTDRDASLPLSLCSKSGRAAVDLQPFSIYLATTYTDAPNQVPAQVFVNTVFQHLWPYIQQISGVYGYSFKYDLVFLRRLGRMTMRRMLRRKYGGAEERNVAAGNISNRRHLQMGGSDFKAVLYGCVELADGYSTTPSYNDIQAAIETAFSGDNLRTWLTEAQNGGVDATGVTTLDEEGNVIGVVS